MKIWWFLKQKVHIVTIWLERVNNAVYCTIFLALQFQRNRSHGPSATSAFSSAGHSVTDTLVLFDPNFRALTSFSLRLNMKGNRDKRTYLSYWDLAGNPSRYSCVSTALPNRQVLIAIFLNTPWIVHISLTRIAHARFPSYFIYLQHHKMKKYKTLFSIKQF